MPGPAHADTNRSSEKIAVGVIQRIEPPRRCKIFRNFVELRPKEQHVVNSFSSVSPTKTFSFHTFRYLERVVDCAKRQFFATVLLSIIKETSYKCEVKIFIEMCGNR